MKIALIQINPLVGDFAHNSELIVDGCRRAAALGCGLAILPELVLSGYPPQDLLERPAFLADHQRALERLIHRVRGIGVLCGAITPNPAPGGKGLYNSALLFAEGRLLAEVAKRLLPTYDVFDEARYFEPGPPPAPCHFQGLNLAVTICEDVWNDRELLPRSAYRCDPVAELLEPAGGAAGVDLFVNIAASPFGMGKNALRESLLRRVCSRYGVPLAFVNQVGGQDTLIFDGGSLALDRQGRTICRAAAFAEDLVTFELTAPAPMGEEGGARGDGEEEQALAALTLGTRDYVRKCGFSQVVVGLSGGVDSALTAVVAARALGPENVLGVAMPSSYSSAVSLEDARQLAANLGIEFAELPITEVQGSYLESLAPLLGEVRGRLTEQNIQARIRGNFLMALANHRGRLVLSTGNKSEMAVGYCTLYGDMSGGLAVLADVPKTLVYRLSRLINREKELIPWRTIERPPSAELAPNQRDDDDLPPYEVLDPILQAYLEEQLPLGAIVERGFDPAVVEEVVARVRRSEHKRRQAPPGLKISGKAFGPGRRYPIAENYRERIVR
ncbi:NAD+ synthase [Desulfurivibrio sp. D14AmB]|uniref:NAD+ synthase n=1 Tax=Desulfurivibrio sp. D14AmB TaxID=3374370 RepID=UPI00376EAAA1